MPEKEDVFANYIQRLEEKIYLWQGEKILLHGAGEHSRGVLERVQWGNAKFLGFSDRSERSQAEGFLGYPVISPERIVDSGATKVVISSFCFQEEIFSELTGMNLPGVEIVKLYTERDLLTFIKQRYAHCPKNGNIRPEVIEDLGQAITPTGNGRSLKVLLIHPPFDMGNHRHKKILPMNLLYLAGYALKEYPNTAIRILDGQIHDLSMGEMKEIISRESWDIIGMGYWTGQAATVFELSKFILEETKSLLVHGGVHPTLCPEETVEYSHLTLMNEGEETFSEIIGLFPDREAILKLPGIAFRDDSGLKVNPPKPPMEDLDRIPFPAFHLIPDLTIYDPPMHVTGGLRVPLIGSRGCPYTCTFCASPVMWNRKVRWRKPEKIVEEMETVVREHGITQFHFWDDNLLMRGEHIRRISEEILRKGLKIHWCGLSRASHVINNKDVLPIMKEAGCVGIEVGIESFSEDSTQLVEKGEGVKEMREASLFLEKAGIAPLYTHMLFNPGEDIKGYAEKQKFLDEVNSKNTAFLADSRLGQASTPHRKTAFEKQAGELGEVFLDDHSTYIHHRVNFLPNSLLEDIPVKTGEPRESPFKFLEIILQAIFDWDEDMIDQYVMVYHRLWEKMDGARNVRLLSEEIKEELSLDDYRSKIFVCLAIVGLARAGSVRSLQNSH